MRLPLGILNSLNRKKLVLIATAGGHYGLHILFTKDVDRYLFTKKEYCTAHKYSTETVINASRIIKKFDHCCIYRLCSLSMCRSRLSKAANPLRLHFQDFATAHLSVILV